MPANPQDNPFAQAMQQARTAAEDFSRLFMDTKLPSMPNGEAMLGAHRRNVEALTAANRIAMEGAQAVARRQMEIMQQSMADLTEQMRALASNKNPSVMAAQQAEALKIAYERAVANGKELTDLIQRANAEAVGALHHRFVEAMDEVKQLAGKTGT